MTSRTYTTSEAATELGISSGRVRRLVKTHKLGRREGKSWVLTQSDIDKLRDRKPGWKKGKLRTPDRDKVMAVLSRYTCVNKRTLHNHISSIGVRRINDALRELEEEGLVEQHEHGYTGGRYLECWRAVDSSEVEEMRQRNAEKRQREQELRLRAKPINLNELRKHAEQQTD